MNIHRTILAWTALAILTTSLHANAATIAPEASATTQVTLSPIMRPPPTFNFTYFLPGDFALRTRRNFFLTAIDGGGRATDPTIVTGATSIGSWEHFRIAITTGQLQDKSFQTATGNYITAVNAGGMTSNALHTDATQIGNWERFRMTDVSTASLPAFSIQTYNGHNLTAVAAGGQYQDAIHTDGYQVGSWEEYQPVKCGDLASGYTYYILDANGESLEAYNGGGLTYEAFGGPGYYDPAAWARFKLVRQSDGRYALQTSTGNYLTALQAGGLDQSYYETGCGLFSPCIGHFTDIFHTDATQVGGWEKFTITEVGSCKYSVQTTSGYYFGVSTDSAGHKLHTTDHSPATGKDLFEFVMSDLASPPIIH